VVIVFDASCPLSPLSFIKEAGLGVLQVVVVDKGRQQWQKPTNIFSLGDALLYRHLETAAAVASQSSVTSDTFSHARLRSLKVRWIYVMSAQL
jgi:hypothetical protein